MSKICQIDSLISYIRYLLCLDTESYPGSCFRGSKYNMEKTKRKLLLFYHYRKQYPFYYGGFSYDDPKIRRVLDKGAFFPLPAYDALGRRILVCE